MIDDVFGLMRVTDSDQASGRHYCCPCGWRGWSVWGHARKHAERCEQAWPSGDPPCSEPPYRAVFASNYHRLHSPEAQVCMEQLRLDRWADAYILIRRTRWKPTERDSNPEVAGDTSGSSEAR